MADVEKILRDIAAEYPERYRKRVVEEIPRQVFQIGIVLDALGPGASIVDLGGGTSLFAPGCAALGLNTILLDDFRDFENDPEDVEAREEMLRSVHAGLSVRVIEHDTITNPFWLGSESLDALASFDAIEHFHHSPRMLFTHSVEAINPGGLFFLGAPNCVNLRKRITVPLGRGKWSSIHEWYEKDVFRGHVREPDVDDLLYVARDLGLSRPRVHGRNWKGLRSPRPLIRGLTVIADHLLRLRPSLCSDIYVTAFKPGNLSP
jgi:SAM-dependent methyltransferase